MCGTFVQHSSRNLIGGGWRRLPKDFPPWQTVFLGRWLAYVRDGHDGNVGLKSRDPSDYQVPILEVCGSALTTDDIIRTEALWKDKLQSREMGLNRN